MSSKKYKRTSTADVNLYKIQNFGGNVRGVVGVNTNAAARYLKLYDSDSAVAVGTTVPDITIALPASGGFSYFPTDGINFKLGIFMAITTLPADNDATAPSAGDVILTVLYE